MSITQQHRDLEAFIDGLELRHFRGAEFTPYWSRKRGSIQNTCPHESLWPNIVPTLMLLDEIRARMAAPITLLSTYRSPAYNRAVGGEPNSFHMQFRAIDWTCTRGNPKSWRDLAASLRGTKFKLPGNGGSFVFRGGVGRYDESHFLHIDTRGYDANWVG